MKRLLSLLSRVMRISGLAGAEDREGHTDAHFAAEASPVIAWEEFPDYVAMSRENARRMMGVELAERDSSPDNTRRLEVECPGEEYRLWAMITGDREGKPAWVHASHAPHFTYSAMRLSDGRWVEERSVSTGTRFYGLRTVDDASQLWVFEKEQRRMLGLLE